MGPANRLLKSYYFLTPVFFLTDVLIGAPIRVAALTTPHSRYLYYGFAMGCGVICHIRPKAAPWVGITESSVNILLLILAVMLPIFNLPEVAFSDEPVTTLFTPIKLTNFAMSAAVLLFSFYSSQAAIRPPWGRR